MTIYYKVKALIIKLMNFIFNNSVYLITKMYIIIWLDNICNI